MRIVKLENNGSFKFLWMKTVRSVDLSVHCAKCLLGTWDSRISHEKKVIENIELYNCVYYICGVAYPWCWSKNFHLAFEPCEGENIDFDCNQVHIVIEGARALPILEENIDPLDPHIKEDIYRTCRNWQFAHWFKKNRIKKEDMEQLSLF